MATPHRTAAPRAARTLGPRGPLACAAARQGTAPRRDLSLTRRYEVTALMPDGRLESLTRVAPATPAFEDAFAALARGTLISTADGPVAVEDLTPGTLVETVGRGPQPLLWVGAITLFPQPGSTTGGEAARLTRLATDALGLGRPMPDLVLGPRARVLYRHAACREILGAASAFAPARAFVDGVQVTELSPVSPVRVHHLAFHGQQILNANGIEVESFHPGPQAEAMMDAESLALFLSLFPHLETLQGFGPMETPRLTAFELEGLLAS